jgi:hypothetical protein
MVLEKSPFIQTLNSLLRRPDKERNEIVSCSMIKKGDRGGVFVSYDQC